MDLVGLVSIPEENRDSQWESGFFHQLTSGKVNVTSESPQMGPDGWPYMLVETDPQATESVQQIFQWLRDKGIGFVVNAGKEYPDYVFTYGMIWHFLETGLFYRPSETQTSGKVLLKPEDIASSGNPPGDYLPEYVRVVLRDFFQQQGVLLPKILAINLKNGGTDLIFSLESLGNPPEAEHQGIGEAISWFLPPHYSVILMGEKGLPSFFDL